jgi:hypothetical protein
MKEHNEIVMRGGMFIERKKVKSRRTATANR